jgi:hypothetical protein
MYKIKPDIIDCFELPEKHIPYGDYCFVNAHEVCPFWTQKVGEYPPNEDGYCHFLNKSDWDLNEGCDPIIKKSPNKSVEGKKFSEVYGQIDEIDPISGKKVHFGFSLLWDQCKECGINKEDLDDVVYTVLEN